MKFTEPGNGLPQAYLAGFWRRFAAFLTDALLLSAFFFGLAVAMSPTVKTTLDAAGNTAPTAEPPLFLYRLICAATCWLYFALQESAAYQATPGKRLFRLKVAGLAGNRLSFYQATLRHFCKILSVLPLLAGFIIAAFTRRRQALHDLLAQTLVVKKQAPPGAVKEKQPGSGNLR